MKANKGFTHTPQRRLRADVAEGGDRRLVWGFTLIEILLVVAVIGILASVVLVGLGGVRPQAKDARRISDLRQVQNGLELYYNKCGYYPGDPHAVQPPCPGYQNIDNDWGAMTSALTGSALGIKNVPNDPDFTGSAVNYNYGSDGQSYVLGAVLDINNPALVNDVDGGDVLGVNCNDPSPNQMYCVQL